MATPDMPTSVDVSYIKSSVFRSIHADGCFGGIAPKGYIHMGVFAERPALPRSSKIEIVNGAPGAESITDTRGGIVREFEVDLIFDLATALSVSNWLKMQANTLRQQIGMPDDIWQQMLAAGA